MIESLTNCACAAQVNCLQKLGLKAEDLKTVRQWAQSRSATLRFSHHYTCSFSRKEKRKVESPSYVTETKTVFGTSKTTEKVVQKVTDYFWTYTAEYKWTIYKGNSPSENVSNFFLYCLFVRCCCTLELEVVKWSPPVIITPTLLPAHGRTTM